MQRSLSFLGVVVLAALALAAGPGCSSSSSGGGGEGTTVETLVIATADFESSVGRLATLDLSGAIAEGEDLSGRVGQDLEDLSSDPAVRVFDGQVYVVNRFGFDNVQVIDPAQGFATTAQFSTGNGSNPQDVAVIGAAAFVPRFNGAFSDVLVMSLEDGSTLGTVDLSAFVDPDGGPDLQARPRGITSYGGHLLVWIQNIDAGFSQFGRGFLVAIDPSTASVVASMRLLTTGPDDAAVLGDELYLTATGVFFPDVLSGGVEVVDLDRFLAGETEGLSRLAVDDDDLGGHLGSMAVRSASEAYVVISLPDFTNQVVRVDPSTGAVGPVVFEVAAFVPDVVFDGDRFVAIASQDFASPGIVLVDVGTGSVHVDATNVGLPPASLALL